MNGASMGGTKLPPGLGFLGVGLEFTLSPHIDEERMCTHEEGVWEDTVRVGKKILGRMNKVEKREWVKRDRFLDTPRLTSCFRALIKEIDATFNVMSHLESIDMSPKREYANEIHNLLLFLRTVAKCGLKRLISMNHGREDDDGRDEEDGTGGGGEGSGLEKRRGEEVEGRRRETESGLEELEDMCLDISSRVKSLLREANIVVASPAALGRVLERHVAWFLAGPLDESWKVLNEVKGCQEMMQSLGVRVTVHAEEKRRIALPPMGHEPRIHFSLAPSLMFLMIVRIAVSNFTTTFAQWAMTTLRRGTLLSTASIERMSFLHDATQLLRVTCEFGRVALHVPEALNEDVAVRSKESRFVHELGLYDLLEVLNHSFLFGIDPQVSDIVACLCQPVPMTLVEKLHVRSPQEAFGVLAQRNPTFPMRAVLIQGPRGVGKSALAAYVGAIGVQLGLFSHVIVVPLRIGSIVQALQRAAESIVAPEARIERLWNFADDHRFPSKDEEEEEEELEKIVGDSKPEESISKIRNRRMLVIYDGLKHEDTLRAIEKAHPDVPLFPPRHAPVDVLITSRVTAWPKGLNVLTESATDSLPLSMFESPSSEHPEYTNETDLSVEETEALKAAGVASPESKIIPIVPLGSLHSSDLAAMILSRIAGERSVVQRTVARMTKEDTILTGKGHFVFHSAISENTGSDSPAVITARSTTAARATSTPPPSQHMDSSSSKLIDLVVSTSSLQELLTLVQGDEDIGATAMHGILLAANLRQQLLHDCSEMGEERVRIPLTDLLKDVKRRRGEEEFAAEEEDARVYMLVHQVEQVVKQWVGDSLRKPHVMLQPILVHLLTSNNLPTTKDDIELAVRNCHIEGDSTLAQEQACEVLRDIRLLASLRESLEVQRGVWSETRRSLASLAEGVHKCVKVEEHKSLLAAWLDIDTEDDFNAAVGDLALSLLALGSIVVRSEDAFNPVLLASVCCAAYFGTLVEEALPFHIISLVCPHAVALGRILYGGGLTPPTTFVEANRLRLRLPRPSARNIEVAVEIFEDIFSLACSLQLLSVRDGARHTTSFLNFEMSRKPKLIVCMPDIVRNVLRDMIGARTFVKVAEATGVHGKNGKLIRVGTTDCSFPAVINDLRDGERHETHHITPHPHSESVSISSSDVVHAWCHGAMDAVPEVVGVLLLALCEAQQSVSPRLAHWIALEEMVSRLSLPSIPTVTVSASYSMFSYIFLFGTSRSAPQQALLGGLARTIAGADSDVAVLSSNSSYGFSTLQKRDQGLLPRVGALTPREWYPGREGGDGDGGGDGERALAARVSRSNIVDMDIGEHGIKREVEGANFDRLVKAVDGALMWRQRLVCMGTVAYALPGLRRALRLAEIPNNGRNIAQTLFNWGVCDLPAGEWASAAWALGNMSTIIADALPPQPLHLFFPPLASHLPSHSPPSTPISLIEEGGGGEELKGEEEEEEDGEDEGDGEDGEGKEEEEEDGTLVHSSLAKLALSCCRGVEAIIPKDAFKSEAALRKSHPPANAGKRGPPSRYRDVMIVCGRALKHAAKALLPIHPFQALRNARLAEESFTAGVAASLVNEVAVVRSVAEICILVKTERTGFTRKRMRMIRSRLQSVAARVREINNEDVIAWAAEAACNFFALSLHDSKKHVETSFDLLRDARNALVRMRDHRHLRHPQHILCLLGRVNSLYGAYQRRAGKLSGAIILREYDLDIVRTQPVLYASAFARADLSVLLLDLALLRDGLSWQRAFMQQKCIEEDTTHTAPSTRGRGASVDQGGRIKKPSLGDSLLLIRARSGPPKESPRLSPSATTTAPHQPSRSLEEIELSRQEAVAEVMREHAECEVNDAAQILSAQDAPVEMRSCVEINAAWLFLSVHNWSKDFPVAERSTGKEDRLSLARKRFLFAGALLTDCKPTRTVNVLRALVGLGLVMSSSSEKITYEDLESATRRLRTLTSAVPIAAALHDAAVVAERLNFLDLSLELLDESIRMLDAIVGPKSYISIRCRLQRALLLRKHGSLRSSRTEHLKELSIVIRSIKDLDRFSSLSFPRQFGKDANGTLAFIAKSVKEVETSSPLSETIPTSVENVGDLCIWALHSVQQAASKLDALVEDAKEMERTVLDRLQGELKQLGESVAHAFVAIMGGNSRDVMEIASKDDLDSVLRALDKRFPKGKERSRDFLYEVRKALEKRQFEPLGIVNQVTKASLLVLASLEHMPHILSEDVRPPFLFRTRRSVVMANASFSRLLGVQLFGGYHRRPTWCGMQYHPEMEEGDGERRGEGGGGGEGESVTSEREEGEGEEGLLFGRDLVREEDVTVILCGLKTESDDGLKLKEDNFCAFLPSERRVRAQEEDVDFVLHIDMDASENVLVVDGDKDISVISLKDVREGRSNVWIKPKLKSTKPPCLVATSYAKTKGHRTRDKVVVIPVYVPWEDCKPEWVLYRHGELLRRQPSPAKWTGDFDLFGMEELDKKIVVDSIVSKGLGVFGSVLGVVGATGTGKSSLLRAVAKRWAEMEKFPTQPIVVPCDAEKLVRAFEHRLDSDKLATQRAALVVACEHDLTVELGSLLGRIPAKKEEERVINTLTNMLSEEKETFSVRLLLDDCTIDIARRLAASRSKREWSGVDLVVASHDVDVLPVLATSAMMLRGLKGSSVQEQFREHLKQISPVAHFNTKGFGPPARLANATLLRAELASVATSSDLHALYMTDSTAMVGESSLETPLRNLSVEIRSTSVADARRELEMFALAGSWDPQTATLFVPEDRHRFPVALQTETSLLRLGCFQRAAPPHEDKLVFGSQAIALVLWAGAVVRVAVESGLDVAERHLKDLVPAVSPEGLGLVVRFATSKGETIRPFVSRVLSHAESRWVLHKDDTFLNKGVLRVLECLLASRRVRLWGEMTLEQLAADPVHTWLKEATSLPSLAQYLAQECIIRSHQSGLATVQRIWHLPLTELVPVAMIACEHADADLPMQILLKCDSDLVNEDIILWAAEHGFVGVVATAITLASDAGEVAASLRTAVVHAATLGQMKWLSSSHPANALKESPGLLRDTVSAACQADQFETARLLLHTHLSSTHDRICFVNSLCAETIERDREGEAGGEAGGGEGGGGEGGWSPISPVKRDASFWADRKWLVQMDTLVSPGGDEELMDMIAAVEGTVIEGLREGTLYKGEWAWLLRQGTYDFGEEGIQKAYERAEARLPGIVDVAQAMEIVSNHMHETDKLLLVTLDSLCGHFAAELLQHAKHDHSADHLLALQLHRLASLSEIHRAGIAILAQSLLRECTHRSDLVSKETVHQIAMQAGDSAASPWLRSLYLSVLRAICSRPLIAKVGPAPALISGLQSVLDDAEKLPQKTALQALYTFQELQKRVPTLSAHVLGPKSGRKSFISILVSLMLNDEKVDLGGEAAVGLHRIVRFHEAGLKELIGTPEAQAACEQVASKRANSKVQYAPTHASCALAVLSHACEMDASWLSSFQEGILKRLVRLLLVQKVAHRAADALNRVLGAAKADRSLIHHLQRLGAVHALRKLLTHRDQLVRQRAEKALSLLETWGGEERRGWVK